MCVCARTRITAKQNRKKTVFSNCIRSIEGERGENACAHSNYTDYNRGGEREREDGSHKAQYKGHRDWARTLGD